MKKLTESWQSMNDVIASYVDEFNLQLARKQGNDVVFECNVVRNV